MPTDVQDARRISAAMVDAARTGKPMSLAVFAGMADVESSEEFARLAVRVAYFNAELAAALLKVVEHFAPGVGDQAVRDLKVRTAYADSE